MRCATYNVLADAYTGYGDYSHVDPEFMLPGARTKGIVRLIDDLDVDVIGLQEAEEPLVQAFGETGMWQTFWSPKGRNKPDGCLTLVRPGIDVHGFATHEYGDGSGHIMQILALGRIAFANTHIKWAPADSPDHIGVSQTTELLARLGSEQQAVIFADCNDRPGGPVRQLVEQAGFTHPYEDKPTAIVNQELVALDLLAVRGLGARCITRQYDLTTLPNRDCPSDHIPIVAELAIE
jgi:mRNA deadenylase 3'-5' endonuclease subunit Ccr4